VEHRGGYMPTPHRNLGAIAKAIYWLRDMNAFRLFISARVMEPILAAIMLRVCKSRRHSPPADTNPRQSERIRLTEAPDYALRPAMAQRTVGPRQPRLSSLSRVAARMLGPNRFLDIYTRRYALTVDPMPASSKSFLHSYSNRGCQPSPPT